MTVRASWTLAQYGIVATRIDKSKSAAGAEQNQLKPIDWRGILGPPSVSG